MEILFEFIFEMILELIGISACKASKSSRVPRPLRFILAAVIILFYIAVIALVFIGGALLLKRNVIGGLFIIGIGLLMLILSIRKFRSTYLQR
ncbi:MAG: hypothetical protein K5898_12740 [Ruminococcus sp.]|uniref:hypothetical protein n=1 Tax=Ruminococcus sp. TaxID=41978 RepID=UPI0025FD80F8|nr:hypothetical protein [Ruminococcus sp.]MCR4796009.1 hypothetical protein [Ruminococcus sp.]